MYVCIALVFLSCNAKSVAGCALKAQRNFGGCDDCNTFRGTSERDGIQESKTFFGEKSLKCLIETKKIRGSEKMSMPKLFLLM